MNFLWLKEYIIQNDNNMPSVESIGVQGIEAIETLLLHFDVEWIAQIFPALKEGVCQGYAYSEDLLYQIERNIVDNGVLYYYDPVCGELKKDTKQVPRIKDSNFHYQYYGGYDLFSIKKMKKVWWPFYQKADRKKVNDLRKALCLDTFEEQLLRKARIHKVTDEEFLEFIRH